MEERDVDINHSKARQLAAQLLDHTGYCGERYYELEDVFTEEIRDFLYDNDLQVKYKFDREMGALGAKIGDKILDTKRDHLYDISERIIGDGIPEVGTVVDLGAAGNHDLIYVRFGKKKTVITIDPMDDAQGHCRYYKIK